MVLSNKDISSYVKMLWSSLELADVAGTTLVSNFYITTEVGT